MDNSWRWLELKKNVQRVGFPGGSDGKESACNAGDPCSGISQSAIPFLLHSCNHCQQTLLQHHLFQGFKEKLFFPKEYYVVQQSISTSQTQQTAGSQRYL